MPNRYKKLLKMVTILIYGLKIVLNFFSQLRRSKDCGPRFHKNQHILISILKKFNPEKQKRKSPSLTMCYVTIWVKYYKKILSKSDGEDGIHSLVSESCHYHISMTV